MKQRETVGTVHIHVAGTGRRNSHPKRQKKVNERNAPGVTVAWVRSASAPSNAVDIKEHRALRPGPWVRELRRSLMI